MFALPLQYDEVSPKARMSASIKRVLESLFQEIGKSPSERFLRIASNTKTSLARSTMYVLNEGVVDSSRSFSFSKHRSNKRTWITPNGWKAATIACFLVFIAEAKVINNHMQYRFSLVRPEGNGDVEIGEWHINVQAAFAYMEPHLSEQTKATMFKLSKEIVLGVHTDRIQDTLWQRWEELKRGMNAVDLLICCEYESNSQLDEYLSPVLPQQHDDRFNVVLSLEKIVSMFSLKSNMAVPLRQVLMLLDAGLGVRIDYLLQFLRLIERCAEQVWRRCKQRHGTTLEGYWQMQLEADQNSLEFKAALYVFGQMADLYPSLHCMETDCKQFCRKVIGLPNVKECEERFIQTFSG